MAQTRYGPVEFPSEGISLRGRLYLPRRLPAPVVVMAHGFSATIPMVLDRYAEAFQESGLAVLAFDQPGLGSSHGHPRGEINPLGVSPRLPQRYRSRRRTEPRSIPTT